VKIGTIDLGDYPLFLAPMEDVTDPSFRYVCKQYGADMMYTEFISSDGLIRNARKSLQKLDIFDYERPIGIQIYGHLKDAMVQSAIIVAKQNPTVVDINFGCPVKKIAARGAGSGMLRNVPLMIEITKAIVDAVDLPVTVKTRIGYDESNKNIVEVAEMLQDVGIQSLAIHGRTREQLYRGEADWSFIGAVKNNPRMKIPIVGNGDVNSPEKARLMFDRYGVDGIMIGRASIGQPWIFRQMKHYLKTGETLPSPSLEDRSKLAIAHLTKSLEWKGEPRGIYEMRRHFTNYFKGVPEFKDTRMILVTSNDPRVLFDTLARIPEQYAPYNEQVMQLPYINVYEKD
jgi:tRNA-dihydrouridine synthase B